MILSFKPQFNDKIIKGIKIHTIREDKHNRWKPGRTIQFANGIRTKNYKQFFEGECKSIQPIKILHLTFGIKITISKNGKSTAPRCFFVLF